MVSWQFLSYVKGTVRTKETACERLYILDKSTAMHYDRVLCRRIFLSFYPVRFYHFFNQCIFKNENVIFTKRMLFAFSNF